MLSCPSDLHPRVLVHLFLRGPGFNSQSAWLSRKIPCDMAVTSSPHTMPPQHLSDKKKKVHIFRWQYKGERPCGQFFHNCRIFSNYPFLNL